jgi:ankyrin repeat protein
MAFFKTRQEKLNEKLQDAARENKSTPDIQALLDDGAQLFTVTNENKTLLDLAGNEKTIRFFLEKGLRFSTQKSLDKAVFYCVDNGETLLKLIQMGAETNYKDSNLSAPLLQAALKNSNAGLKILLENKAETNVQGRSTGNTALHFAIKNENREAVRILLQHGAQTDIKNMNGFTAVEVAQNRFSRTGRYFYQEVLDEMIKPTAPVKTIDTDGTAPSEAKIIVDAEEISFIREKPALGQRITETFNFKSGIYREVIYCETTNSQSSSMILFEHLEGRKHLANAEAEFVKRGGVPDYVLKKRLDKL